MYNSYREALMLGKVVEQPNKVTVNVVKNYSLGQIKKMCIWGKIDELKNQIGGDDSDDEVTIDQEIIDEAIMDCTCPICGGNHLEITNDLLIETTCTDCESMFNVTPDMADGMEENFKNLFLGKLEFDDIKGTA